MVVFLPYQIHLDCSVQCRSSDQTRQGPGKGVDATPIANVDAQISVWFDLTAVSCE